ncbi:homing endonuclease associated repeat-containing protein [Bacillus subtilis]|uniref:homing endonuclease associated repeat-containing protein n=1 Tax=Bacillus subtilis TaxID=1423 RepID=UPI0013BC3153|nr:hypothetical protein [Bacillus subtilis]KAF2425604.1 hypothetical protein B6K89_09280 [Bacillus subtilis]
MGNQYSSDWNEETIIKEVKVQCHKFFKLHNKIPSRKDWDNYKLVPSRRTAEKNLGMSFNEILKSLGVAPNFKSPNRYTDRELLLYLRQYFDQFKQNPSVEKLKSNSIFPNPIVFQRRFGSWSRALDLAGFQKGKYGYANVELPVEAIKINNSKKVNNNQIVFWGLKTGIWSNDEEEVLRSLYQKKSYHEIAQILNRSYNSVKVRAKVIGLTKNQKNPFSCIEGDIWSEEEITILEQEYSHNPKIKELLPGREYSAIVKKANFLGLKMKRGYFLVNSHFFEELDEISAYIAGFIAADGYVCEQEHFLEITLAIKDRDHLRNIANHFDSDLRVIITKNRCRMKIVNHKIVDDLVKLGIVQRKSLVLKYPRNFPKNLHRHFIRGFIDGDGSINPKRQKGRLSILGTEDFLLIIRSLFFQNCDVGLNKLTTKGNIFELRYHGGSAKKILDWLYEDANFYLIRKYDNYVELKSNFKNDILSNPIYENMD